MVRHKSQNKARNVTPWYPNHQSQRPAANAFIDFNSLDLDHPLRFQPSDLEARGVGILKDNFWTEPPSEDTADQGSKLPFAIERTGMGKSLPVYTDYKGAGTKVVTVIRKIRGDVHAFKNDLEKVIMYGDDHYGPETHPKFKRKPKEPKVSIGVGKIIVRGNYHARIKLYLACLGF